MWTAVVISKLRNHLVTRRLVQGAMGPWTKLDRMCAKGSSRQLRDLKAPSEEKRSWVHACCWCMQVGHMVALLLGHWLSYVSDVLYLGRSESDTGHPGGRDFIVQVSSLGSRFSAGPWHACKTGDRSRHKVWGCGGWGVGRGGLLRRSAVQRSVR